MTGEDPSPRTLYVGNLSPNVTEDLLLALFGQFGECKSVKIIHEAGNDPYAFVEFVDPNAAAIALTTMNKRVYFGKETKVNWATRSGHQKQDTSKLFHIFVGDLAPDIDQQTLREAFAPFGEISDTKIMKDPQTMAHKGYGFVSFVNKADAESAIAQMNGQWLGTRKIRTNWATRRTQAGGQDMLNGGMNGAGQMNQSSNKYMQKLDYNDVWNRGGDNNTTVYCGGVNNITDDLIRSTFGMFGQITGVHSFSDRGYAFVRFATKEAACNAICGVHGMEINGGIAKCSWGKANIDITSSSSVSSPSSAVSSMGSSLYGGNTQTAAAAAQNPNWAAANYQWPGQAGYPQNTMNYWQGYPGYQNAMMQQTWGVGLKGNNFLE